MDGSQATTTSASTPGAARRGLIAQIGFLPIAAAVLLGMFTGVSSPYEPPETPDLRINTAELPLHEGVGNLVQTVLGRVALSRR